MTPMCSLLSASSGNDQPDTGPDHHFVNGQAVLGTAHGAAAAGVHLTQGSRLNSPRPAPSPPRRAQTGCESSSCGERPCTSNRSEPPRLPSTPWCTATASTCQADHDIAKPIDRRSHQSGCSRCAARSTGRRVRTGNGYEQTHAATASVHDIKYSPYTGIDQSQVPT